MMDLPPVVQIVVDEELWKIQSPQELKKRFERDGLGNELVRQAEWTVDEFGYAAELDKHPGIPVVPSGSLNPFSPIGKCFSEACTLEATEDFIKSVGLYTEQSVVSDPLTEHFLENHEHTEYCYEHIWRSVKILEKLRPLLEAKVLSLANPIHRKCADCKKRMDDLLNEATETLLLMPQEFKPTVSRDGQKPSLSFELPILEPTHDHRLRRMVPITKLDAALLQGLTSGRRSSSKAARRLLRSIIGKTLRSDLRKIFFDLEMSREFGSLMLAGSRAETLVISTLDRKAPRFSELENWERLRTVHLPWVANLTSEEVLALRGEASMALPRLRELLKSQLVEPQAPNKAITETVAELRAQALEVQTELNALKLPKERNYRAGMLGLAMAFVIYGVASQSPPLAATSIAALLATLGHLRAAEREHDSELTKLVSTPAYALLKAKEIIGRRG